MKPKHQRLWFIGVTMVLLVTGSLLIASAFRENLIFFYNPSELAKKHVSPGQLIRIGGLVKHGSMHKQDAEVDFLVTDNAASVYVQYSGMLPTLFREGQGVVAEGYMKDNEHFLATRVLTKHDEKYMPKEVVDSLKQSGRWQGDK